MSRKLYALAYRDSGKWCAEGTEIGRSKPRVKIIVMGCKSYEGAKRAFYNVAKKIGFMVDWRGHVVGQWP